MEVTLPYFCGTENRSNIRDMHLKCYLCLMRNNLKNHSKVRSCNSLLFNLIDYYI